jgi:hypothetical protein
MFTVSIHERLRPWKPPFSRSSRSTCIKVLADRALAGKESLREAVARAFQKSRLRGTGAGRSPASGRRMNLGVGRGGRISIHGQPRRSATESTVSTFFLLTGGGHDIPAPAYLIHTHAHTSRTQLTSSRLTRLAFRKSCHTGIASPTFLVTAAEPQQRRGQLFPAR